MERMTPLPSILERSAPNVASAGHPSKRRWGGGLEDRGWPVPARDELLDPVSLHGARDAVGDEIGLADEPLQQAVAEARAVREPRGVDEARVDRVDDDAATCELDADRARERELRVFRGAVGARVPGCDRARHRGDVDDICGSAGL